MTPDVVEVGGKSVKVLFENDKIRVLQLKFKKGQKLSTHSHPANFIYALTSMKLKSISADGKASVVKMKKGESAFSEGSTHSVENQTPSLAVQVELK